MSNRQGVEKTFNGGWDAIKWIPLVMSIVGVFFWITGTAYEEGFWSFISSDGFLIAKSFQQVALLGFVGPIQLWLAIVIFLSGMGLLLLATGAISLWLNLKSLKIFSFLNSWLSKETVSNRNYVLFPTSVFLLGGISAIVIFLTIILAGGAYKMGKKNFAQRVCAIRKTTSFPSVVHLSDGSQIQGFFISRSEKISVLLNDKGIYVTTASSKPQLLDFTNTAGVNCETKK